ncbi:hypothetical protein DCCM_3590 [Desulfocucumis palustris]|uniref:Uncharacterized protein n=1 Tax=Desulfocucumis palustris TaxID=1898651 RepID=A0A2L2XEB8_9FIRM|nr:hypothetical protein DCCM_3590 [Desulfocucumis palustris]
MSDSVKLNWRSPVVVIVVGGFFLLLLIIVLVVCLCKLF